ncbi:MULTISPECIES: hypothetical protein [unclassified Paenibacillus]|uniref:hypothetical protein n=2 Tax=Bacillales TaxID=1385 RepID=UPI002378A1A3|nr:hypothetical protein [Paenibacillus sp. MAHUQ-63]
MPYALLTMPLALVHAMIRHRGWMMRVLTWMNNHMMEVVVMYLMMLLVVLLVMHLMHMMHMMRMMLLVMHLVLLIYILVVTHRVSPPNFDTTTYVE